MEIDKTLALPAPPPQVWALLLDPRAMGACVPGMESIQVVSADEYTAVMRVKIAFISARFTLRTRIVERREPVFLRAEGTGEDTSVASSLKQRTEMQLDARADGGTDLRLKVQVDLQGRMGTFGLSAMKTKADRLWDEFGVNLAARLAGTEAGVPGAANGAAPGTMPTSPEAAPVPASASTAPTVAPAAAATASAATARTVAATTPVTVPRQVTTSIATATAAAAVPKGGWARLLRAIGIQPAGRAGVAGAAGDGVIVVEVTRPDQTRLRIEWPQAQHAECAAWLRDAVR